jgi:hypothetical protein
MQALPGLRLDGVRLMASRPTVMLVDIGDERQAIEEERQKWLRRVLVALGADEDIISSNTMEAKRHLAGMDIVVWRNAAEGTVRIYRPQYVRLDVPDEEAGVAAVPVEVSQKLVAEWLPPKMVRIKEGGGRQHYRITLREWALPFQMGED